jgi:hypothetical protein
MEIRLGNSGNIAIIDDEDYNKISHCKWYLYSDSHNQYARNKGNQSMHRLIVGAKNGEIVDHKDGNGLNNRNNNLRICTHSQNLANRKVLKKTGSKYLGVYKDKRCWVASCRKNKVLHRKYVSTEVQAAIEYNKMAIMYHGEFARLNIIPV